MTSLIKKKKANTIYYYVVESARVDGKPRIVHQTYLGTAESVARLVQDRTAPVPCPPPRSSSVCPALCGWLLRSRASSHCFSRSGPSRAPALRLRTICCWPRSIVSASRGRRLKWPTGIGTASCLRCGDLPRNDFAPRTSGIVLIPLL